MKRATSACPTEKSVTSGVPAITETRPSVPAEGPAAQPTIDISKAEPAEPKALSRGPFELELEGYGDVQYAFYDYSENENQNEGSRGQSRAAFDTTRFTVELEGNNRDLGLEFEAEMEYEHGGTGSSVELEQDEFGEFESEVEKGGDVELEEIWVRKFLGDGYSVRAGRFYVNVGLLSEYHLPTDYLASGRPETETTIIPGVWDEVGFELQKEADFGKLTFQIVNGLDSTGFSASQWVASGHQEKFETSRAQDLAYVARIDTHPVEGMLLGASGYIAPSTSQNRPKDDLDVDGGVYIVDAHARYIRDPFRLQSVILWGHLNDAEEISERNARLSNTLGVARTPVADEAIGTWTELGYNVSPLVGMSESGKLEPFLRFDYYDTYFETADSLIDNPRFERFVYTAGIAYTYDDFITTKIDWTHRDFGSSDIDSEEFLRLGLGFVY